MLNNLVFSDCLIDHLWTTALKLCLGTPVSLSAIQPQEKLPSKVCMISSHELISDLFIPVDDFGAENDTGNLDGPFPLRFLPLDCRSERDFSGAHLPQARSFPPSLVALHKHPTTIGSLIVDVFLTKRSIRIPKRQHCRSHS